MTDTGKRVMHLPQKEKYLSIIKAILSHRVFYESMQAYLARLSPVDTKEVVRIIERCRIHKVKSHNTMTRRAKTVIKWIDWILDQVE